ncbi:5' nucleotidase, NT5C type [Wenxinia saemankumensis]|uniref:5'(3')-deoxyribonucleotidase n=1 Tax=Wenxinia saemankumensis TaxID=1447782 RepID=A0A1M6AVX6_9RHOB|nr:hypothetical protein [Wenxinia saemankumensis]SHI40590.1 5'(3')-deoxyribonucleotidase [Wenxinia saemankumensis]
MRIAVDMDEVIADTLAGKREAIRRACGVEVVDAEMDGRKFKDVIPPEAAEALEEELRRGAIYGTFAVMPGAAEALRALHARHDLFIATAAMDYPMSLAHKFEWLRDHFPFLDVQNFVFCGDKSVIAADLLIDDSLRHFARFAGRGILFDAPHNRLSDWPFRLTGWTGDEDGDAVEAIERMARAPGPGAGRIAAR